MREKISIAIKLMFLVTTILFLVSVTSTAASSKAKVLSFSDWVPLVVSPEKPVWEQMAKDLEKATGGKFTIKLYGAQILGKAKEHYELVVKKVADIGRLNVGFTPGRFPVTDIVSYAFAPSSEAYTKGMLEVEKKGCMKREYAKVKLLYVYSGCPSNFIWRKGVKAATSLNDFKGRKIRVPTTGAADLVEALGASAVAMPMPEVYTSMERGVVDGVLTTLNTLDIFHLGDVSTEVTRVNALTFGFCIIMNKDTWDKLPDAGKAILEKNAEKYALECARNHDKWDRAAVKKCKPKFYNLPASDLRRLKELSAPDLKAYMERYDSKGFKIRDAAQIFYQTLKKEYNIEPYILSK